jgi:two-component system response regulator TctD
MLPASRQGLAAETLVRILLVEHNADLAGAVGRRLRHGGHAVDWEADGLTANVLLAYERYDLVILDSGPPRMDGVAILSHMRDRGDTTPALVLTVRTDTDGCIHALDAGADDCLAKPFDMGEFEARCRALLRRRQVHAASTVRIGALVLDHAARRVLLHGATVHLPRREYSLLEILVGRLGQVVHKQDLANRLFGFDEGGGPNAVEVYIGRLRRRLGDDVLRISTVRGVGYMAEAMAITTTS